jgi:outer membrane protein assembly factor BamE
VVIKHSLVRIACLVGWALLLSACWLKPYKLNITQGNRFVQSKLERVEPGMTREQVEFLLGTPVIVDPFRKNRWDYLYLRQPGYGEPIRRMVSIYFSEDNRVSRIEGDIEYSPGAEEAEPEIKADEPLPELPELPDREKS